MATVSVSVSDELKKIMDSRKDVNWSAVARNAFERQLSNLEKLALLDKLTVDSKVTDEDIEEISKRVKRGIADWHNEQAAKRKRLKQ